MSQVPSLQQPFGCHGGPRISWPAHWNRPPPVGRFARPGHELVQFDASTDLEAISQWLATHATVPTTFENYRKDLLRFLLWLGERRQAYSDANSETYLLYEKFLREEKDSRWVGPPKPLDHEKWRPFSTAKLKPQSIRTAFSALKACAGFLHSKGYLRINPIAKHKTVGARRAREHAGAEHYFDEDLTRWVWQCIVEHEPSTPAAIKIHARRRWAYSLLFLTGIRRAEAVANQTIQRNPVDGLWEMSVVGKGGVKRILPLTEELRVEMCRYLRAFDVPNDYPGELPADPASVVTCPSGLILRMVWFSVSATYTAPALSQATS